MDYETICNCFVAVFQHYTDDSIRKVFIINNDKNDYNDLLLFFNNNIKNKEYHISYNGLAFDSQITEHLLQKKSRYKLLDGLSLAKEIYNYAQKVIERSEQNTFQEFSPYKLSIKQIDLFKLNHWDNRAKMSSLKWIQYSMDWYNVEEMPHHHNDPVKTKEELDSVVSYCINDVLSTKEILHYSKEQIQLRQTLTNEYGIDLYSASEPRISKELFLHFLTNKLEMEKADIKNLRTHRNNIIIGDCILPYIKFKTPVFQELLEYFQNKVITSTKDGFKYSINYKGVKTDYGLGGIHGSINAGVYSARPGWTIMTSDVTSFYPNLAIRNGFHPKHLPKKEFCELYEWFFEERKKIPKTDPKNYVYKIILNSTYGLTGDENSFLYDPQMTMQITVNGQLLLTLLYEMLTIAIPDAVPLMQNTDGLEMIIPNDKIETYMKVCHEWEQLTQLQLEHDEYSKMIIRDVNNYIAIYKNGKVKSKGAFEWEDLDKKKVAVFHKNKSFLVIPKAIYAYFVNGIKPEDYLEQNKNIVDYCAGIKIKGNWYHEERKVVNQELIITKQQKIVRYFVSNSGSKLIKCNPDGREIQIEAGQWMQTVVNNLDIKIPFENYDINKKYYLESIYKEINQIEQLKTRSYTQLSLF